MNTTFTISIMPHIQKLVGADLSRTPPILAHSAMHEISVGADLSGTSPIYRPSVYNTLVAFPRRNTSSLHIRRSSTPTEGNS